MNCAGWVHVLLRGLVTGLGTAIGATVITGIVVYLLYKIADYSDSVELLENFFNNMD